MPSASALPSANQLKVQRWTDWRQAPCGPPLPQRVTPIDCDPLSVTAAWKRSRTLRSAAK
jgi:hypothetical protein